MGLGVVASTARPTSGSSSVSATPVRAISIPSAGREVSCRLVVDMS